MEDAILLTVEAAADRLSVGRSTIYKLVEAGDLPLVRIGQSVRIPARAVVEFAERLQKVAEEAQRGGSG